MIFQFFRSPVRRFHLATLALHAGIFWLLTCFALCTVRFPDDSASPANAIARLEVAS